MTSLFGTNVTPTGPYQETCGSRFCEPYVLVTSIDLRPPRPEVEVLLYGAWQSTNPDDDDADISPLVWRAGVLKCDVIAAPISNPNDVVFLIALMEHFEGHRCVFWKMIKKSIVEALSASTHLARETRVARLIEEIDRSIDFANGGPNFTSAVEMHLTSDNIMRLETNGCCRFVRSFCAYGGQYCLGIELIKEFDLWTLVPQQDEAFARAAE